MNVAQLLVKCLENEGVEYIFGVPGEENIDLMDALLDSSIEFITTRHETSAAFMAGTYGRLTGKPGVCLATLGPGATNLLTGVANANMDHCPLIAITGQAGLNRQHKISHQYYDLVDIYAPVTKWNAQIKTGEIVPEVVRKAYQLAMQEKPGATHIDLPEDVAEMEVDVRPLPITGHSLPQADEKIIQEAVDLLSKSTHPIILAGNGITRGKATEELKALAEKADIPVVHSFMGKGALSWKHERSLLTAGLSGKDHITCGFEQADLIIPIGFDMAETPPQNWNPTGETPILHIDTEEAEIDSHYPVALNVVGDIKENLKQLSAAVPSNNRNLEWADSIRRKILDEYEHYQQDDGFPVKPQKIISDLREVLEDEDIVISDVGAHKMWMARMYHTAAPNTCLISNGLASMGVAVPGAIAAKMAAPDRKAVAVCGDGSFLMTGAELETAVRLKVPIIVLLWRDDGYGLIEWHQMKKFERPSYIEFGNPDFIKLAESFGMEAIQVNRTTDLRKALDQAVAMDTPVLIDCPVDYSENMKLTEKLNNITCD
ncbi:acetolactate synthase large subunit [Halobacillus karajensis]|uniref:Acetolactate synthase n=1 Tax=Halobacillus karajensis TaxID=195088 RepID=A0A024P7A1_9BACI|nr:acetolactate synthase large subunit [Halobacillus karajensis]CDQ20917.1 Acetolactate synthase [Halobacillus karajensis]CDQ25019.1 Acetolactate synthase [Halobacillus karajensis]CDQ28620.1 Acetolactate synthase [Halobacillus karajensis]